MGSSRLDYAAPEVWACRAMEHLQEAWGTVHASFAFADKDQLLAMKKGLELMVERVAKAIVDFDNRPPDEDKSDDEQ